MSNNIPDFQNDSVLENFSDVLEELSEVELDRLLNNEIVKDIPVISTAVNICKAVNGIRERAYIKKLARFIQAVNNGIATNKQIDYFKAKVTDKKKRDNEIGYLLIIIDRFLDEHKSEMLAKIYLAYIDKSITWKELTVMAEIIDRFLPGDYELLKTNHDISIINNTGTENALRLVASGLLLDVEPIIKDEVLILNGSSADCDDNTQNAIVHNYSRTHLGDKMILLIM